MHMIFSRQHPDIEGAYSDAAEELKDADTAELDRTLCSEGVDVLGALGVEADCLDPHFASLNGVLRAMIERAPEAIREGDSKTDEATGRALRLWFEQTREDAIERGLTEDRIRRAMRDPYARAA